MPCYRCGVRQTDPARGPSPWKRAVRGGGVVLVCPDCQRDGVWVGDVDHCPTCNSHLLGRTLGETTCKACGATVPSAAPDAARGAAPDASAPGLSDEVAAALERAFDRPEQ